MNNRKSLTNLSLVCLIACLALLGCSFGVGNTSNTTNNTSNTSNGGNNRSTSNSASPSTNSSPSGNSSRDNANGGGASSNSPGGTTGGGPGGATGSGGGSGGTVGVGGGSSGTTTSVRVLNESRYAIHYLYLSPTSETNWGQDQLGSSIIQAGGNYTITNVPCGNYDIKLVDQDRDECEVRNVRFCTDQNTLRITDQELLRCEGYGR